MPTLLVMGDSLNAAYGIAIQDGWVALMQQHFAHKFTVVNASISGETTSGGKARLLALLKKHQPNWVILELGANDALRGQNLKTTERNLQTMVDMSSTAGAKVLLQGIRIPSNYGPAYDKLLRHIYQSVATKNNLVFDPFFLEPVALDPNLMQADGLHPNAKAQPKIFERARPLIEELISQ